MEIHDEPLSVENTSIGEEKYGVWPSSAVTLKSFTEVAKSRVDVREEDGLSTRKRMASDSVEGASGESRSSSAEQAVKTVAARNKMAAVVSDL